MIQFLSLALLIGVIAVVVVGSIKLLMKIDRGNIDGGK